MSQADTSLDTLEDSPPPAPAQRLESIAQRFQRLSRSPWFGPAILVLVGLVSYSNSFQCGFVFDDSLLFEDAAVFDWRADRLNRQQRPVGVTTFAINHALHGYYLEGYHIVNLAIHLIAGLALYGIARRTLAGSRLGSRYGASADGLALVIALLWLAHPLQTQSVTYVAQRFESLMGMFYLLMIYCLIRAATSAPPPEGRMSLAQLAWYGGSLLCLGLGLGSKEIMATAPLMALWYDRVFLAPSWRRLIATRWLYYVLVLAISAFFLWSTVERVAVGLWAQLAPASEGQPPPKIETSSVVVVEGVSPRDYLQSQPGVILHYLRLCFYPAGQCLDYGWPVAHGWNEIVPQSIAICGLLLATLVCMWFWPALGFVGGWFFLILAPTSSIVPIKDLCFEHRMYLPLASVVVLVTLGVYGWLRWWSGVGPDGRLAEKGRRVGLLFAVWGVLILGLLTFLRNLDYKNEVVVWEDVTEKRPQHARGFYNLAESYVKQKRFGEAIPQYEKSLALKPTHAPSHLGLAKALDYFKDYDQAIFHFREAVRLKPEEAEAWSRLGRTLRIKRRFEEAIPCYQRAIQLEPKKADHHANLAAAFISLRRFGEAIDECRTALRIDPNHALARERLQLAEKALP